MYCQNGVWPPKMIALQRNYFEFHITNHLFIFTHIKTKLLQRKEKYERNKNFFCLVRCNVLRNYENLKKKQQTSYASFGCEIRNEASRLIAIPYVRSINIKRRVIFIYFSCGYHTNPPIWLFWNFLNVEEKNVNKWIELCRELFLFFFYFMQVYWIWFEWVANCKFSLCGTIEL